MKKLNSFLMTPPVPPLNKPVSWWLQLHISKNHRISKISNKPILPYFRNQVVGLIQGGYMSKISWSRLSSYFLNQDFALMRVFKQKYILRIFCSHIQHFYGRMHLTNWHRLKPFPFLPVKSARIYAYWFCELIQRHISFFDFLYQQINIYLHINLLSCIYAIS